MRLPTRVWWHEPRRSGGPHLCAQLSSSGGPFLLGEFSAVDCALACVVGHCVRWSQAYGLSAVPQLEEYLAACTEREAFKRTYADADTFGAPSSESAGRPKL